jgi:hypothetical protein
MPTVIKVIRQRGFSKMSLFPGSTLTRSTSGIGKLGYWLSKGILVVGDQCRDGDQYRAKESYGGSGLKVEGCQNEKTDMARRVLTDLGRPRRSALRRLVTIGDRGATPQLGATVTEALSVCGVSGAVAAHGLPRSMALRHQRTPIVWPYRPFSSPSKSSSRGIRLSRCRVGKKLLQYRNCPPTPTRAR